MSTTQIAIIGGGPAGLQAAMSIGRVHRQAVLFDSGEYRNGPVQHMHNVAGFDGTPPADFRAHARAQLEPYAATVDVRTDAVTAITRDGDGFVIENSGETVRAHAVILATGMRDILPDIPGANDLWGRQLGQCPYCHGHEYTGKKIAFFGAPVVGHYAAMMHTITDDMVALAHGQALDDDAAQLLEAFNVPVRSEEVVAFHPDGYGVRIEFAGGEASQGEPLSVDGVFLLPGMQQRAPFAEQLGLAMQDSGAVAVDEWRRTSLDGVFAAGDLAHTDAFPMPMASVVQSLASGQQAAITAVQYVMAKG